MSRNWREYVRIQNQLEKHNKVDDVVESDLHATRASTQDTDDLAS